MEERMKVPASQATNSDELKYGSALVVTIIGFVGIAFLVVFVPVKDGWKASEVTALVGTLTTVLGTIVGAFLGIQVGSAGKQKAEDLANRALASLAPEEAEKVILKNSQIDR
jgi:divalent metal cation (Fe/Co/Zn/Cd) transporter